MKQNQKSAWQSAFKAAWPLCFSYLPVGLACGILLQKVGFNVVLTGLLSILVFSGGAQFLVASMLAVGASFSSTILMVFFLEMRYVLLSSSLSLHMKSEKRGFLALFSQSLNDENYAVNYLKYSTDETWNGKKALYVNWFSLAAWLISNLTGNLLGSLITVNSELVHFALTAMFIYMLVMQMKNPLYIATGVLSGVLAVIFMLLFQNTFGLIVATVLASFAAYQVERFYKMKKSKRDVQTHLFPFVEKEATKHE